MRIALHWICAIAAVISVMAVFDIAFGIDPTFGEAVAFVCSIIAVLVIDAAFEQEN